MTVIIAGADHHFVSANCIRKFLLSRRAAQEMEKACLSFDKASEVRLPACTANLKLKNENVCRMGVSLGVCIAPTGLYGGEDRLLA